VKAPLPFVVIWSSVLVWSSPTHGAPILGTAGAGLQPVGAPSENLSRYWDGNSWDSTSTPDGGAYNPCNAGSLAIGVPCAANATAPAPLAGTTLTLPQADPAFQAWGSADGSADLNFTFLNEPGGSVFDFTMLGEITYASSVNEIGWYAAGSPGNRQPIFGDGVTAGATAQVYIPVNFGLYYLNTATGSLFFTQSIFNGTGTNQQFAAFQQGGYTIVGLEDVFSNVVSPAPASGQTDYDYNDTLVGFGKAAAVPEPSTLLALSVGLTATALRRISGRRRA
jgi:hypothetical protein